MCESMTDDVSDDAHVSLKLEEETQKWLRLGKTRILELEGDESFLENISAYISDTSYFLEKKDFIRSFEAVIWAWAWMEIGERVGILKRRMG